MKEFTMELLEAPKWLKCGKYVTPDLVSVWDRYAGGRVANGDFVYVRFSMDTLDDGLVTAVRWNVTDGHGRSLEPTRSLGVAVGDTRAKQRSRIQLTYGGELVTAREIYMYGTAIALGRVSDE